MRGRISFRGRWRMLRRQGSYSLPGIVAERLEGALQGFGNRDAAADLARLLARCHRRAGRPFVVCRRALSRVRELGLSEDEVRGAVAVLEKVGFLTRVGGGGFDQRRRRNAAVVWRLDWAARKSPTEGLRPEENRSGGIAAPCPASPVLGPLRGLPGYIPNGGTMAASRVAAQAALDRVRGEALPRLSARALSLSRPDPSPWRAS
jgi:hypothetical protein